MSIVVRNITTNLRRNNKSYAKSVTIYKSGVKVVLRPMECLKLEITEVTEVIKKLVSLGILEIIEKKVPKLIHVVTKIPKETKTIEKKVENTEDIYTKGVSEKVTINNSSQNIFISICTFNRSETLKNLLTDILNQKTSVNFFISIFDDNSEENYSFINDFKGSKLVYYKSRVNNGKQRYWVNINHQLKLFQSLGFDYFLQMDDDFLICDNFLDLCIENIKNHTSVNKKTMAMRIHKDFRANKIIWGTKNWVDGGTLYKRAFFENIGFKINPINEKRWVFYKKLSSGVWEQLSRKMQKYGWAAKNTNKSLVYHIGYAESKMNPEARKKINIKTIDFHGNKNKLDNNTRKN